MRINQEKVRLKKLYERFKLVLVIHLGLFEVRSKVTQSLLFAHDVFRAISVV